MKTSMERDPRRAVRGAIRTAVDSLRSLRRRSLLKKCSRTLAKLSASRVSPTTPLLQQCRTAWGNEAWSADLGFVKAVAELACGSSGRFLDCGSGLSTIVAASLCCKSGGQIWSLEQDEAWYLHMRETLERLELDNVVLMHAPLVKQGDFAWYDTSRLNLPRQLTAAFCDGPAVLAHSWPEPFFSNWRAGLVETLTANDIRCDTILLDDAEDSRCSKLRHTWERFGYRSEQVETPHGSYVISRPVAVG